MSVEQKEAMTQLNLRLPKALHAEFKDACEDQGATPSEVLRQLMESFIQVHGAVGHGQ